MKEIVVGALWGFGTSGVHFAFDFDGMCKSPHVVGRAITIASIVRIGFGEVEFALTANIVTVVAHLLIVGGLADG